MKSFSNEKYNLSLHFDRSQKSYFRGGRDRGGRLMLVAAKYISLIFTPFYLPVVGMIVLFIFSYLSMMPWLYKGVVIFFVWLLTNLMPQMFIRLYGKYQGWSVLRLISREGRMVPYVISIACYFVCFYMMNFFHLPHFMSSIVVAALAIQILCALINNWWKVSTHTAAIGGVQGSIMAFGFIFDFNPVWWICLLLFLAGIVGTSRTLLRMHTLGQVCGGFAIGLVAAFIAVIMS